MGGININDVNQLIKGSVEYYEFFPYDIMPLDAIRKKLREVKWNFLDIEYMPIERSIYPPSEGKPF